MPLPPARCRLRPGRLPWTSRKDRRPLARRWTRAPARPPAAARVRSERRDPTRRAQPGWWWRRVRFRIAGIASRWRGRPAATGQVLRCLRRSRRSWVRGAGSRLRPRAAPRPGSSPRPARTPGPTPTQGKPRKALPGRTPPGRWPCPLSTWPSWRRAGPRRPLPAAPRTRAPGGRTTRPPPARIRAPSPGQRGSRRPPESQRPAPPESGRNRP